MEYYLAIKKEWIIDTHNTWRNLPRITLSEKANLKILYTVWFHFYNIWNEQTLLSTSIPDFIYQKHILYLTSDEMEFLFGIQQSNFFRE